MASLVPPPSLAPPAGAATGAVDSAQVLMTFEEVAVHFSRSEWFMLDPAQKALYKEVMVENYVNVASLAQGFAFPLPSKEEAADPQDCLSTGPEDNEGQVVQDSKEAERFAGGGVKTEIKDEPFEPEEPSMETTAETISSSSKALSLDPVPIHPEHEQKVFGTAKSEPGYAIVLVACGQAQGRPEQKGRSCSSNLTGEREEVWVEFGKIFRWKSYLIPHETSTPKVKLYQCSVCGKNYSTQSILATHRRIHTGEKPYTCSFCGRSFAQRAHAEKHERIHTGEKPHVCGECGRGFIHHSSLVAHERYHARNGPHLCCLCGQSFVERARLVNHQRIHMHQSDHFCPKLSG
ncbi:zinc finger protein 189-like isoform X2 [Varanus komodoensis]|uniref:zinc finger protein 189-like isoform X2 n=1 Tax=Varanus komodoensis TaxID=61221 RepID=UPI001CF7D476|nr:zinc finger protein 189-like isoform X2 [Varanus komodoensis]